MIRDGDAVLVAA